MAFEGSREREAGVQTTIQPETIFSAGSRCASDVQRGAAWGRTAVGTAATHPHRHRDGGTPPVSLSRAVRSVERCPGNYAARRDPDVPHRCANSAIRCVNHADPGNSLSGLMERHPHPASPATNVRGWVSLCPNIALIDGRGNSNLGRLVERGIYVS